MAILNLIQHQMTDVQISQLNEMFDNPTIVHLKDYDPDLYGSLSNSPANERILFLLAERLSKVIIMDGYEAVIMPLGSPAFMFIFSKVVSLKVMTFLFAHTERVSEDQPQADGTVKKVAVFKHVKWLVV